MSLPIIFALASSLIGISCFVPYIRDIFIHKTKPHSYSWLVWTILQGTGAIAMFQGGAGIGVTSLAIGAFLCGFIFVLSFFYGTKNITTFDTACLIASLISLIFYFFAKDPLLTVILVSLIDFIGFIPTLKKSYFEPETETSSTYFLSGLSSILALGALEQFTPTTSLYLFSVVFTNLLCAILLFFRKKS